MNTRGLRITLYLLVASAVLCGCRRSVEPVRTSVCAVRAEPARFRGANVIVSGRIVSDFLHSTVLIDERCPSTGLGLSFADPDPLASDLLRQLARNPRLAASLETTPLTATVAGRFERIDTAFVLTDARISELRGAAPPN